MLWLCGPIRLVDGTLLENKIKGLKELISLFFIFSILFHFRQTPDDNNITVLSKGSSKGFTATIPIGGHWAPSSIVGDKALVFILIFLTLYYVYILMLV